MGNWENIEKLFKFQDYTKKMKLEAKTEKELNQIKANEKEIENQLKNLYVN